MDRLKTNRLKTNIENTVFSNKTIFLKNRRQGNNWDMSENLNGNWSSNLFSNWFNGDNYTQLWLWLLLLILVIIICYITVMTAKFLSTDCPNKRSWFKYIIRFCYNDVCIPPNAPVINNVHYMNQGAVPPKLPGQPSGHPPHPWINSIKNDFNKFDESVKNDFNKIGTSGGTSDGTSDGTSVKNDDLKKGKISFPLFGKKEIFHIANQDYTYEQAKCKCESYNAKLATYNQLVDAYNDGAEWCSYGWSNGQKAYYPTQKCNWEKKSPEEKLKCGTPGLNGGFFADPYLKFGVNCYGKKPKGQITKLKDQVCNGGGNYCELPQNYGANNRLETDEISPFNTDKWNN